MNKFEILNFQQPNNNQQEEIKMETSRSVQNFQEYFYTTVNGFRQAARALGNTHSLKTCLNKIYREYRKDESGRKRYYQAEIEKLEKENELLRQQIQEKQTRFNQLKHELPENNLIRQNEQAIADLQKQIRELQHQQQGQELLPESEFNPIIYKISAGLLVVLSIYLMIFYISVGYSAFFKDLFRDSRELLASNNAALIFSTIFDVQAIKKSIETSNFFVLLFPAVFLALAFVIHRLYEDKKFYLLGLVILLTFIFDAILAFRIGEQIHHGQYLAGLVEIQYYTPLQAAKDINVYSVLFAGFVVYIICSIVFHYFLVEWQNKQPIKSMIKQKKIEIRQIENAIAELQQNKETYVKAHLQQLEELKDQIQKNEQEINRLQGLMQLRTIDWAELENRIDTFTLGWLQYVAQDAGGESKAEEKTSQVFQIVKQFKDDLRSEFKEIAVQEVQE